jgi:hypothetical protein
MCLNTAMTQVRLPVIPEQCRLHHDWGPGLVDITWETCDCPSAQAGRGGHITFRCRARFADGRCEETWTTPLHKHVNRDPLGHRRPGNR